MNCKTLRLCLLLLLSLALATPCASASPVTLNVQFTAASMQVFVGAGPAPVDPVTGEFVITYDPAIAVTDNTSDISLVSLNIALGSALSFSYDPAGSAFAPAGRLRVGGVFGADSLGTGADRVQYAPATNDFWLYINDFATSPTFEQLGYSQTASGNQLFGTVNSTGATVVKVVPEPASLFLAGLMLSGAGAFARMRRSFSLVQA
ncbi:MAG: hypothetical protein IT424_03635 [Pirellulales bacterium]|nr:hypothetical protein [Pirellulales bacterium]